jgi:hypothetical protein
MRSGVGLARYDDTLGRREEIAGEKMSNGTPQFTTAEYSGQAAAAACKACKSPLGDAHYRVNGALVCASCTQRIKAQMPDDSHSAFVRGISFGVGGALLGFGMYVGFALATGLMAGIVSLAVGYVVGKAIIMGSKGVRGRRYQIAAVLLTYTAVSLSAVPIFISQQIKQRSAQHTQAGSSSTATTPKMSPVKAIGILTLIGLASPFLALVDPTHGLIGLVILFVGLRIAWRLTAGGPIDIVGPINEAIRATPA